MKRGKHLEIVKARNRTAPGNVTRTTTIAIRVTPCTNAMVHSVICTPLSIP
jgi:hypothetical protein